MEPSAGVGRRFLGVAIDSVILVLFVATPLAAASGSVWRTQTLPDGSTTHGLGITLDDRQTLVVVAVGLVYAIVMEATVGATIGKLLLGVRVRSANGGRAGWGAVVARNLLRVVDAFPYFLPYAVGGFVAVSDQPLQRRVGDRAARTIVVRARH